MHGLCEKCELNNGFLANLAGGVSVVLCPECTTEWHAFIRNHDSLRKMQWATAVMQSLIREGGIVVGNIDYSYRQAQQSHSEHSNILFDVALEWLGRKQPVHTETQPFKAEGW